MSPTITIPTGSAEETRLIGQYLGEVLEPGTVITLDGDLGSGKTTFVQGIGKGLGIADHYYLTSPTYNLINQYFGRLCFSHIDLYRLGHPEELDDLGLEETLNGSGISAIEWPDRIPDGLLTSYLSVTIAVTGDESRSITITTVGTGNAHIVEVIKNRV